MCRLDVERAHTMTATSTAGCAHAGTVLDLIANKWSALIIGVLVVAKSIETRARKDSANTTTRPRL